MAEPRAETLRYLKTARKKGTTGPQDWTLINSKNACTQEIGAIGRHRNGAGPSRSSSTLWPALRLFPNYGDGVDVKDGCPSLDQVFLDGFEFVDRLGFNRGGDAVFALYFLVHLPCPPGLMLNRNRVEMVWRADEGLGPSTLRGSCGAGRRKLRLATLEEGRRRGSISSALPSQRGSRESPQAPAMEYVIVAE